MIPTSKGPLIPNKANVESQVAVLFFWHSQEISIQSRDMLEKGDSR